MKRIWLYLIILLAFSWGTVGCSDRLTPPELSTVQQASESLTLGKLNEVAPPSLIQQLQPALEQYQPQVSIISPKSDQVLKDTTVEVKLQVQDLPIFQDPDLKLGPHLELILDNEPYQAIYDINQAVVLENLAPGTHTLRVFAARPWYESFKNDGAYAQTTFNILTKTDNNRPAPNLPLLTYSRPNGNYGAEPILLDFYLTNAPLHLVAQENPEDEIVDWRIRVTINDESFLLDNWQPIYLKGFEEGRNWIQLEFLDEQGNSISNIYNNTVRLISYTPNGQDALSKLVRGELSLEEARGIIDPNYKAQSPPVPSPTLEPVPTEEELPTSSEEISPEDISSEEEKILPSFPNTSVEEIPTSEEEILPEDVSPAFENSATVEETKDSDRLSPSIEKSPTIEDKVSSEKSTEEGFSSSDERLILEEKTSDVSPSELEEIIPTTEDETAIISPSVSQEPRLQIVPKTTIEEPEPLSSYDSFTEKPTPLNQSSKSNKWLEKIRSRFKGD